MNEPFRITVQHFEEEFVPPDESMPPRVKVTVRLNGLVVAKRTWTCYLHESPHDEPERLATEDALRLARGRIEKWRRAVARYDASQE